jgi:uncharacterized protein YdeI (YjbR/CyaY-like superfamily)
MSTAPTFFDSPAAFNAWLAQHHATEKELLVGFHKVHTGLPSMSWSESVDEALCYGWIDGVRRSLGEAGYTIRFTPRRPGSIWSAINVKKIAVLSAEGRMHPAGMKVWEARKDADSPGYSTKDVVSDFSPGFLAMLEANPAALKFYNSQPRSYRTPAQNWVMTAKQEATRMKRMLELIADSEAGLRVKQLRPR